MNSGQGLTQLQRSFLSSYKEKGTGLTGAEFCRKMDYKLGTYYVWLSTCPEFKEKLKSLAISIRDKAKTISEPVHEVEGLKGWEIDFIKSYRNDLDTDVALRTCNKSLKDVEEAEEESPKFAEALGIINRLVLRLAEDAIKQGVRAGKYQSAKLFLEKWNPRYAKKIHFEHGGGISLTASGRIDATGTWGELYGVPRSKASLTDGSLSDIVEGEILNELDSPSQP